MPGPVEAKGGDGACKEYTKPLNGDKVHGPGEMSGRTTRGIPSLHNVWAWALTVFSGGGVGATDGAMDGATDGAS
jgi:hypothetical protein